jgi:hypothetical protein
MGFARKMGFARNKGKGVAGAGGAIQDGMGTWLMGFARNNGVCSSVTAEL